MFGRKMAGCLAVLVFGLAGWAVAAPAATAGDPRGRPCTSAPRVLRQRRCPLPEKRHPDPPYFHCGKVWGLTDAVTIMGTAQLGVQLNAGEAEKIGSFLRTLTGDQPQVTYPILPPNSATTPRPVLSSR